VDGEIGLPGALRSAFDRAALILSDAQAVLITAGAGMGVDSGLPDFRGRHGFWNAYPAIARLGKSFVEMANPVWFETEPRMAWGFYGHRLNMYRATEPHEGFYELREITESKEGGYFIYTSNVDGQFHRAGYDPLHIDECHGSIHVLQCSIPCSERVWGACEIDLEIDEKTLEVTSELPECDYCGAVARPNVLMFGDTAWIGSATTAQERRYRTWLQKNEAHRRRLVVVEIGAGKAVPTVRRQSEYAAERYGGMLIRINPRDADVPSGGHISLPIAGRQGIHELYRRIR